MTGSVSLFNGKTKMRRQDGSTGFMKAKLMTNDRM
jgi:hypothetical protein